MKSPSETDQPLHVLCLEDTPQDAEILAARLVDAGYRVTLELVANEADFTAALETHPPDVILADYTLPGFDGPAALRCARRLRPTVPFICVSGTIGEETAVELLKQGATDYVLKDRPARLAFAVRRALDEARAAAESRRMEATGRGREEALRESEERLQMSLEATGIGLWDWDMRKDVWYSTDTYFKMLGYDPTKAAQNREVWDERTHPEDREFVIKKMEAVRDGGEQAFDIEFRFRHADGTYRWINSVGRAAKFDDQGRVTRMLGLQIDITARRLADSKLRAQLDELRRWYTVTLGRETRVMNLKREVNRALAAAGLPPRYASVAADIAERDAP